MNRGANGEEREGGKVERGGTPRVELMNSTSRPSEGLALDQLF